MNTKLENILKEIAKVSERCGGWKIKDGKLSFLVNGFCKSGTVELYEDGETIKCAARYNEIDNIETFDDLVFVAYSWWERSKERASGWKNPPSEWVEEFVRLNLVKKKVETVTSYISV